MTDLQKAMLGLWLMGMRWVAVDSEAFQVSAFTEKPERIAESNGYWWADGDRWIEFDLMDPNRLDVADDIAKACAGPVAVELLPWLLAQGIDPEKITKGV
jgi:hypothetical protein